jgi:hypothetical protein
MNGLRGSAKNKRKKIMIERIDEVYWKMGVIPCRCSLKEILFEGTGLRKMRQRFLARGALVGM